MEEETKIREKLKQIYFSSIQIKSLCDCSGIFTPRMGTTDGQNGLMEPDMWTPVTVTWTQIDSGHCFDNLQLDLTENKLLRLDLDLKVKDLQPDLKHDDLNYF